MTSSTLPRAASTCDITPTTAKALRDTARSVQSLPRCQSVKGSNPIATQGSSSFFLGKIVLGVVD